MASSTPEMDGVYLVELKQRHAQKRTGTASRCLRPRSKHRRTVVVQIQTVCPSWLFIKVPQKYASEPCDSNGVNTPIGAVGTVDYFLSDDQAAGTAATRGRHLLRVCQAGPALNSTGLLCLRRPALGWTSGEQDIRPDPDAFFQRHLHLGVYPTAPYPGNNHCIGPSPWADEQYLAYGPLLDAMRGKRWVLLPHCIEVAGNAAKVNLFEVPGGYAMPVTFAGRAKSVEVVLRGLSGLVRQEPGLKRSIPA